MKRLISVAVTAVMLAVLGGTALAQMTPGGPMGMGPGMGWGWGMGPGMMGPGMMGPGMMGMGPGIAEPTITEERAKELAQQYTDNYLKGFKVEHVLPFTWGNMTMYQAELKGSQGESRLLHINPWGNVMPSGGPMMMR